MALPVWGNLAKSQVDAETVEEAIDRLIQAHKDDPDAHIETGQSLESHKASEVIDHLEFSIIADKIKAFEVGREKLNLEKMYVRPNFESFDAWTISGDGSATLQLGGASLVSGSSTNNEHLMTTDSNILGIRFDTRDFAFETLVKLDILTDVLAEWHVGERGINTWGWRFEDGVFSALWFRNTTEYTQVITGISFFSRHTFRISAVAGEKVEFYVDGVLKHTVTATLPLGIALTQLFGYWVKTKENVAKTLDISGAVYLQDK